MQLPYTEDRAVRMLVALLAAADPLGRLDGGAGPDVYRPLAVEMLGVLRDGGRSSQVVATINEWSPRRDIDPTARRAAVAFAAAAIDWWASTERLLAYPVAS